MHDSRPSYTHLYLRKAAATGAHHTTPHPTKCRQHASTKPCRVLDPWSHGQADPCAPRSSNTAGVFPDPRHLCDIGSTMRQTAPRSRSTQTHTHRHTTHMQAAQHTHPDLSVDHAGTNPSWSTWSNIACLVERREGTSPEGPEVWLHPKTPWEECQRSCRHPEWHSGLDADQTN